MITKIKMHLLALSSLMLFAIPVAVPLVAHAACEGISGSIANGANEATPGDTQNVDCASNGTGGTNAIGDLARKAVNLFSFIVGAIAIIMIIYGGFRYITSGGDSGSVGNAKNTLIYAIIGLVIVALAQIIVQFVLTQTTDATTTTTA